MPRHTKGFEARIANVGSIANGAALKQIQLREQKKSRRVIRMKRIRGACGITSPPPIHALL